MSEHECSGTDCASLVRIKALERTLEDEKKERSRSHEKIYNRLGALERGMTAVTTQYSQIMAQRIYEAVCSGWTKPEDDLTIIAVKIEKNRN